MAASGAQTQGRVAHATASAGSADALVAIAAVSGLALLANDGIRHARSDSGFRHSATAPRIALKPIAPGPGLDAAAAQALTKMLGAEARAWAFIYAAAVARARSLGAIRAHNKKAALRQARASGAFAGRAAKALRPVPRLRAAALAALRSSGAQEESLTLRQVRSFQRTVGRGGLPADLQTRLGQLGFGRAQRRRLTKLFVAQPAESFAGERLIGPLADASKQAALRKLTQELSSLAARSRKHPITVSKARPGRVHAKRPHTSRSSSARRRGST